MVDAVRAIDIGVLRMAVLSSRNGGGREGGREGGRQICMYGPSGTCNLLALFRIKFVGNSIYSQRLGPSCAQDFLE